MTTKQQKTAIAEALGWHRVNHAVYDWVDTEGLHRTLPDWPNDLNAMHEAEKMLDTVQKTRYAGHLYEQVFQPGDMAFHSLHATAAQRAEAFLRTLDRWIQ